MNSLSIDIDSVPQLYRVVVTIDGEEEMNSTCYLYLNNEEVITVATALQGAYGSDAIISINPA